MKTDNITAASKHNDNSIELTITDPFDKALEQKKRFSAIRGGISWPTTKGPAYFCIVGQEYLPSEVWEKKPSGPLVLLAEYASESFSLTKFYRRITDIAEQFLCRDFYVIIPENRYESGYIHDFDVFAREIKSNVNLCNAYDADNFLIGVSRIRESIDSRTLTIPEDSIVHAQLSVITREDLENSPEEVFWGVNGLRHVIGSFRRFPPKNSELIKPLPARNWRVA